MRTTFLKMTVATLLVATVVLTTNGAASAEGKGLRLGKISVELNVDGAICDFTENGWPEWGASDSATYLQINSVLCYPTPKADSEFAVTSNCAVNVSLFSPGYSFACTTWLLEGVGPRTEVRSMLVTVQSPKPDFLQTSYKKGNNKFWYFTLSYKGRKFWWNEPGQMERSPSHAMLPASFVAPYCAYQGCS